MARRTLKSDYTGRLTDWVLGFRTGEVAPPFELSHVDRGQLPWMIDHLREAEGATRHLRNLLEDHLAQNGRSCPVCGTVVTGRSDAIYCGGTCRQRARRAAGGAR